MADRLAEELEAALGRDEVQVVVLAGAGGAFSAVFVEVAGFADVQPAVAPERGRGLGRLVPVAGGFCTDRILISPTSPALQSSPVAGSTAFSSTHG